PLGLILCLTLCLTLGLACACPACLFLSACWVFVHRIILCFHGFRWYTICIFIGGVGLLRPVFVRFACIHCLLLNFRLCRSSYAEVGHLRRYALFFIMRIAQQYARHFNRFQCCAPIFKIVLILFPPSG